MGATQSKDKRKVLRAVNTQIILSTKQFCISFMHHLFRTKKLLRDLRQSDFHSSAAQVWGDDLKRWAALSWASPCPALLFLRQVHFQHQLGVFWQPGWGEGCCGCWETKGQISDFPWIPSSGCSSCHTQSGQAGKMFHLLLSLLQVGTIPLTSVLEAHRGPKHSGFAYHNPKHPYLNGKHSCKSSQMSVAALGQQGFVLSCTFTVN